MKRTFPKFLAVAFLAAPLLATPVHAAGDGSSSDTPKCTGGKVWDKAKKKCVDPQRGMIDDDSIYETGRDLAMAGRYGEAITVLSLAADKSDPRILNYLGYSHRKSGRVLGRPRLLPRGADPGSGLHAGARIYGRGLSAERRRRRRPASSSARSRSAAARAAANTRCSPNRSTPTARADLYGSKRAAGPSGPAVLRPGLPSRRGSA